jgi:NADP-dependent 3-hydroxy acid dehydrogenase YdfG
MEDLKLEEWNQTIDVNFKGVLYGLAAILHYFKEQKSAQAISGSFSAR